MNGARVRISDLPKGPYDYSEHFRVSDRGMRRYHPFAFDFDSRPMDLEDPKPGWSEEATERHLLNRQKAIERLRLEYGSLRLDQVVEDVRELGSKPFSFLAHHNRLFDQARRAFVAGAYFPALVAACALGERILNHLILDLRHNYTSSPHYRKVHRRKSFDNWPFAVEVLVDWKVLVDGVADDFLALAKLRNRSIHFTADTSLTARADALIALRSVGHIVSKQFGFFGRQPWFIEGTAGAQFIKREWEANPFVKTYLIPLSGFVGPLYGMEIRPNGYWVHLDYPDYGDDDLDDDNFARAIAERDSSKVVTRKMIEESWGKSPLN